MVNGSNGDGTKCQQISDDAATRRQCRLPKWGMMHKTGTNLYDLPQPWESAIADWLIWLTASGASLATRKVRRSHVRSFARSSATESPAQVDYDTLIGFIGNPRHSQEHRRGLRNSLASFYRWAVVGGVVEVDVTADLPHVKAPAAAPRPATDEVWSQLCAADDERTRLMGRLAAEAGLRRAEVAQVHARDVIETGDGPDLIVHGKGGKQRVVPISLSLAYAIRAAAGGGFAFPGACDGHLSPDAVGRIVSRAMPPGWSMHKLRHRYATRGYAATGNLRAVQEALGHASVATTQRYTAVSSRDVRAVTEGASGHR